MIAETYEEYCAFLVIVEEGRRKFRMRIIAYIVLKNHFHFLLWPRTDGDLSRFMKWIEQVQAQRFHLRRQSRGTGAVYQSRYSATMIRDDRHYLTALRYVEGNARRHGLVERAEHWPWSSAWGGEPIGPSVVLEDSPIPRPINWRDFLNEI